MFDEGGATSVGVCGNAGASTDFSDDRLGAVGLVSAGTKWGDTKEASLIWVHGTEDAAASTVIVGAANEETVSNFVLVGGQTLEENGIEGVVVSFTVMG